MNFRKAGMVLSLAVLIVALSAVTPYYYEQERAAWTYRKLKKAYETTLTPEDPAALSMETDPLLLRSFDFTELQKENPDIVAWLYIPGTPIDYPVCRGTDDSYYLKHNAQGEYSFLGTVFQPAGTQDTDAHIIFFGHNMRSGKMFGTLKKYKEKKYRDKHPAIYVYTPEMNYKALVFGSFKCHNTDAVYQLGFRCCTAEYREWLERVCERSAASYSCGIPVTENDRVITLSTCVSAGIASERFVVNAVVFEQYHMESSHINNFPR